MPNRMEPSERRVTVSVRVAPETMRRLRQVEKGRRGEWLDRLIARARVREGQAPR